jgi:ribose transport system permease protein
MLRTQPNPNALVSPVQPPRRRAALRFLLNNGLLFALLIEVAIFAAASPDIFLSTGNFFTVLRISATTGITVAFYTLALIAGQIDLSTAQVGAATAVIFGWLFGILEWPVEAAFAAAILFAAAAGLISSWLVIRVKIPSLIATLALGTLCYGLAISVIQANSTTGLIKLTRPPLREIVNTEVLGIPATVIVMFVVYALIYVLLNHTRLGAHLYALGGSAQAARLNGIHDKRLIRFVLIGTAVSAGISAIIIAGRGMSAGATTPVGGVLGGPLIAAVFSGVALSGGSGRIERTLIGVIFLAVLTSGLGILNVTPFARSMTEGAAFVFAILIDSIRQRIETR